MAKIFLKNNNKPLPDPSSLKSMGVLNGPWGICGFTSSLYALRHHSPTSRHTALGGAAQSPTRVLAEIKTYLRLLQADGRQDILDSIEAFTTSFPGFGFWRIKDYITWIDGTVEMTHGEGYLKQDKFGIGMPPDAVVDYLKRVCDFPTARVLPLTATEPEMILGMGTTQLGMPLYHGLGHYLYCLHGKIHSWGVTHGNAQTAMYGVGGVAAAHWSVVYKIGIK